MARQGLPALTAAGRPGAQTRGSVPSNHAAPFLLMVPVAELSHAGAYSWAQRPGRGAEPRVQRGK